MTVRVLHVINHLSDAGGAEVSLVQMLPHLQKNDVENGVLPLYGLNVTRRLSDLEESGVRVFSPPANGFRNRLGTTWSTLKEFSPDVVHSTLWDSDLVARVAARPGNVPTIVGLVNANYSAEAYARAPHPRRLRAYQTLDGFLGRHLTTAFHALTQHVADEAVGALGIHRDQVFIIPRGRDRTLLGEPSPDRRRKIRSAMGIPQDAFIAVNIARHEPQKAVEEAIEAFGLALGTRDDAILLQAGREGSATARIRQWTDSLEGQGRVRLLGRRPDVADLLAASDVFLTSSHWEGQGGAVLEAMAMGVPVVGYEVPAVRESLGGTGWLVPIGDVQALATQLRDLASHPPMLTASATAARARFDERFAIEKVAADMAGMYVEVAGRSARD